MANLLFDYRLKPWEIYGGKRPFFVRYADIIADVINDFKLEAIKEYTHSPVMKAPVADTATREEMIRLDPDIFGGKRFAHLHHRGEIYMLNREQWQSFTARIREDLIDRLHTANNISIEQMLDLNDAIDPIA